VFNENSVKIEELGLEISTGKIARQAGGAVVVQQGETVVFSSVCTASKARDGADFFPLTVDYREKMYAAGKVPGGFFKREARPSSKEILTCRLIDRPIRPLFPAKYRKETQIIAQVIAFDQENASDVLALNAASAALSISAAPFNGPIGGVRVGYVNGALVVNPTATEMIDSSLDLIVAGTQNGITMVESQASLLGEELYLEALEFAQGHIKTICSAIADLAAKVGKEKELHETPVVDEELMQKLDSLYSKDFRVSLDIESKILREKKSEELKASIKEQFIQRFDDEPGLQGKISDYLHDIEASVIRKMLIHEKKRIDRRALDEVRPIQCEVDLFKRLHGSALFTRGETQSFGVLTLGGGDDEQFVDGLHDSYRTPFMLHYNFPPFSVGEAGRFGFTSRREIGHGELASKAIRPILPDRGDFPYTIRLVSEIMESNGSSSMASVCSCCLAMMAGGVPIKDKVAGVAMGLCADGDDYSVLTDIQGAEDHYGDMDFKVAGSTEGISALQMDIKIDGVSVEIMKVALEQARKARLHILSKMDDALMTSREAISEFAPRILILDIPKEKIGDIIGPGGKVIRGICEEYGVKVEVDEKDDGRSGTVKVLSVDGPSGTDAMAYVKSLVAEPKIGEIYQSKVVRITDFGAFCEFMPGKDGLLHISKISKKGRLNSVTDILAEGDFISLRLTEKDRLGRYSLSAIDVEGNDF
jgi:polyribonucleotide nucleotidyltransferase